MRKATFLPHFLIEKEFFIPCVGKLSVSSSKSNPTSKMN